MTEYIIRPGANSFEVLGITHHLAGGDGVAGLAYLLLFTWRMAEEGDEIPDGITSRQGFWADPSLGCKWWMRVRLICNDESLRIIKQDALDALDILLQKKIVSKIVCEVWRLDATVGCIKIQLIEPDGQTSNLIVEDIWKVVRENVK